MRGIVSLLAVLVLVTSAGARNAIIGARAAVGVCGAMGELRETANFGMRGEFGVRLTPAPGTSPELEVLLIGGYTMFSSSHSTKPDITFISGGAEFRLNVQPRSASYLYLIGGGGYARTTRSSFDIIRNPQSGDQVIRTAPERIENNPYLTAGAGMVVMSRPNLSVFLELRVVNVFGTIVKNYTYVPLTLGVGL